VPSGTVENEKLLEPKEEKGLITFAYLQNISDEAAELPVPQPQDSNVDGSSAMDGKGCKLCETPFVWCREDGTKALVQTWPTNLNETFRKDFEISEGVNPDSTKFLPQALSEFKEAMVKLFGPAANSYPVWFCHKKLTSASPAVVGFSEHVLAHVSERPELMHELSIASIDVGGLGFVADGTNGKGEKFEKHFRLTAGEECVLYRKTGWDTMGCMKSLHQFLRDAELHELPTMVQTQQPDTAAGPNSLRNKPPSVASTSALFRPHTASNSPAPVVIGQRTGEGANAPAPRRSLGRSYSCGPSVSPNQTNPGGGPASELRDMFERKAAVAWQEAPPARRQSWQQVQNELPVPNGSRTERFRAHEAPHRQAPGGLTPIAAPPEKRSLAELLRADEQQSQL